MLNPEPHGLSGRHGGRRLRNQSLSAIASSIFRSKPRLATGFSTNREHPAKQKGPPFGDPDVWYPKRDSPLADSDLHNPRLSLTGQLTATIATSAGCLNAQFNPGWNKREGQATGGTMASFEFLDTTVCPLLAIRYNSRYDWSRPQTVPGLEPPYPEP